MTTPNPGRSGPRDYLYYDWPEYINSNDQQGSYGNPDKGTNSDIWGVSAYGNNNPLSSLESRQYGSASLMPYIRLGRSQEDDDFYDVRGNPFPSHLKYFSVNVSPHKGWFGQGTQPNYQGSAKGVSAAPAEPNPHVGMSIDFNSLDLYTYRRSFPKVKWSADTPWTNLNTLSSFIAAGAPIRPFANAYKFEDQINAEGIVENTMPYGGGGLNPGDSEQYSTAVSTEPGYQTRVKLKKYKTCWEYEDGTWDNPKIKYFGGYPQLERDFTFWGNENVSSEDLTAAGLDPLLPGAPEQNYLDELVRPVKGSPLRLQRIPLCISPESPLFDCLCPGASQGAGGVCGVDPSVSGYFYTLATDPVLFTGGAAYPDGDTFQWISEEGILPLNTVCNPGGIEVVGKNCGETGCCPTTGEEDSVQTSWEAKRLIFGDGIYVKDSKGSDCCATYEDCDSVEIFSPANNSVGVSGLQCYTGCEGNCITSEFVGEASSLNFDNVLIDTEGNSATDFESCFKPCGPCEKQGDGSYKPKLLDCIVKINHFAKIDSNFEGEIEVCSDICNDDDGNPTLKCATATHSVGLMEQQADHQGNYQLLRGSSGGGLPGGCTTIEICEGDIPDGQEVVIGFQISLRFKCGDDKGYDTLEKCEAAREFCNTCNFLKGCFVMKTTTGGGLSIWDDSVVSYDCNSYETTTPFKFKTPEGPRFAGHSELDGNPCVATPLSNSARLTPLVHVQGPNCGEDYPEYVAGDSYTTAQTVNFCPSNSAWAPDYGAVPRCFKANNDTTASPLDEIGAVDIDWTEVECCPPTSSFLADKLIFESGFGLTQEECKSYAKFDYETPYPEGSEIKFEGKCYESNKFTNGANPTENPEDWDEIPCDDGCYKVKITSTPAFEVSGYTGECCTGFEMTGVSNIDKIIFGSGLRITGWTDNDYCGCCPPSGNMVEISACTPTISGATCTTDHYGNTTWTAIPCTEFECIAFNSGDFCLEIDDDCIAHISSSPSVLSLSGPTDNCCDAADYPSCVPGQEYELGETVLAADGKYYQANTWTAACPTEYPPDWTEIAGPNPVYLSSINDLRLGRGFRVTQYSDGTGACCTGSGGYATIEACTPTVSGATCTTDEYGNNTWEAIPCTGFECITFKSGDFCLEVDDDCVAHISSAPSFISVSGTTGDCCDFDCPEFQPGRAYKLGEKVSQDCRCFENIATDGVVNPPLVEAGGIAPYPPDWQEVGFGDNGIVVDSVNDLRFGQGLTLACYTGGTGDCCTGSGGYVQIDACMPTVSGATCSTDYYGNVTWEAIPCTGFECIAFNSGDFCLEVDDNCVAHISSSPAFFSVSGTTGDCCDFDCPEFQPGRAYDLGERVSQDCRCFENIAGSNVVSPPLVEAGGIAPYPPDWQEVGFGDNGIVVDSVNDLRFGQGLTISCYTGGSTGCCDGTGGYVQIDACMPTVSGATCSTDHYGAATWEAIPCTGFECIAFKSGDFCLEVDDNCIAHISSAPTSGSLEISGYDSYDCCGPLGTATKFGNVGILDFGSGFVVTEIKGADHDIDNECCEAGAKGSLRIDACLPMISGRGCDPYDLCDPFPGPAGRPDIVCEQVTCTQFHPADFTIEPLGDCNYQVSSRGINCTVYESEKKPSCQPPDLASDTTYRNIKTIDFKSGFFTRLIEGSDCAGYDEGCTMEVSTIIPTISGLVTGSKSIECGEFVFDCLGFDTGNFCIETGDGDGLCKTQIYPRGFTVSGNNTGVCGCEDEPLQFEHLNEIRLGSGLCIESGNSLSGDCCGDKGYVTLSTLLPQVSGVACHDTYPIQSPACAPVECFAFESGDFYTDYNGDECNVVIGHRPQLTITGFEGDCCEAWDHSEGLDAGRWREPTDELKWVDSIVFGSGLTINRIFTDTDGCSGSHVEVGACQTKFSGANLNNEDYYSDGVTDAPICDFLSCVGFAKEDFGFDWNSEECTAQIYSAGMTVEGALSANLCTPPTKEVQEHLGKIILGDSLYISSYNPATDKSSKGDVTIDALLPGVSGATCTTDHYGNTTWEAIPCTEFECIAFKSGDFCLEIDDDCVAHISSAPSFISLSGSTANCCEIGQYPSFVDGESYDVGDKVRGADGNYYEANTWTEASPTAYPADWTQVTGPTPVSLNSINDIRLGYGLRVANYEDGDVGCCTGSGGYATIEACMPAISGMDCGSYADREAFANCSGFDCIAFNSGDFAVEMDGCQATVYGIGPTYEGFSDCEQSSELTVTCLTGIKTKNGLIATDYSDPNNCCDDKGFVEISTATSLIKQINDCPTDPDSIDPCYTLNITASLCGSDLSVNTSCSSDTVDVDIQITKADITACLDTCCIEYTDSEGNPASIEVFVPECASDCYGCCE